MLEDRVLSSAESSLLMPRMARKKLLAALVAMEVAAATGSRLPRENDTVTAARDDKPLMDLEIDDSAQVCIAR